MRIAILGNMNNIGFCLMRYFRDLGADAELLLYANDGIGNLSHFRPEDDTYDIERWQRYIHRTRIANDSISSSGNPLFWLYDRYVRMRTQFSGVVNSNHYITESRIRQTFSGYDFVIGNGIAPAIFERIKRRLDIFYPYSMGVEWYNSYELLDRLDRPWFRRVTYKTTREVQARGIQQARHVLNAETGLTESALMSLGVEPKRLPLPMVYNREPVPQQSLLPIIDELKSWLRGRELTLFTSARQMWTDTGKENDPSRKNNHYTYLALQQLKQQFPDRRFGMVAVEYGPDVDATKQLIEEIGLSENFFWLPQSSRSVLMQALNLCDVAVGEFYLLPDVLWGGTGWEAFAMGKPLLQGFNFAPGSFGAKFGHPAPPSLLGAKSPDDIFSHLRRMLLEPETRLPLGLAGKAWFDQYNGIQLAKEWLNLLQ
jgi:hypothetical protein